MKSFLRSFLNKTPVPFASRRESFVTASRKHDPNTAGMEAYGAVGTLHAIVSRLANSTSQVDWHLYRTSTDGRRRYATPDGNDGRTEVTRHAALDLLRKPNAFMTMQEFIEVVEQHIELTGEGWIVVSRLKGAGLPTELWPVRPDKISIVKDADDFLTGYLYTGPDGEKIPLAREDVIMLRMPNPMDMYRGISPVQALMVDLESSRYSALWNRNFFKNNAVPGAVIELPDHLTDTEFEEFQERWRETHQGVDNAHRVGIIEYGGKFVESKFAQRDMQFAELRGVTSEVIREAFGYPKPMLGATDDVNLANAVAGEYVFAKWLLVSRLQRWKGAFNNDLLPMFGAENLEFDFEDPVPVDKQGEGEILVGQAQAVTALVQAGFDPAGVLEVVGLPPIKWKKPEPVVAPPPPEQGEEDVASNMFYAATPYVVRAHIDDSTCEPCRRNDGHVYANRGAAFAAYHNGKGYGKCIGAKYGNECRCVVTPEGGTE